MQVGLVPADLERSLVFYREVIGLPYRGALRVAAGRTLHQFDADALGGPTGGTGATLKLVELGPGDGVPAGRTGPTESFTGAVGIGWITLDVEDLDPIVVRASDAGAVWQLPVTQFRPGLRVAIVEDPDGNAVELVERHDA